jgi:hypothetical protein
MSLLVTGGDLQAREREIGFRGCQPATPRSNCEAQKIPATGSSRRLEPAPKSLNWFSRVQRRTSHVTGAASARPVGRAEQGRFDSISARAGGGVVAAAATRTEGGVGSLPAGWYERATSLIN